MKIYELEYPSPWVDTSDREADRAIQSLFSVMEWELSKAVMALHLYEIQRDISRQEDIEEHKQFEEKYKEGNLSTEELIKRHREEGVERRKLEEQYERELSAGNPDFRMSWDQRMEMGYQIDVNAKRKKWESGVLPQDYKRAVSLLYIQVFVSALDMIGKVIDGMIEETQGLPEEARLNTLKNSFRQRFPDLQYARDSIQHVEDRWRQLKRKYGKSRGITSGRVKYKNKEPMGGSLHYGFSGNLFGATKPDGTFGGVEISYRSLEAAQHFAQSLINIFTWKRSRKEHYPN